VKDSPKTIFCSTSSFLKGSFEAKNSNMEESKILVFFLAYVFSQISFSLDY
jgi:hypothetical protein